MAARKSKKTTVEIEKPGMTEGAVKTADPRKKKAPARAKKAEKAMAAEAAQPGASYVVVDYPKNGEVVSGLHYAIRIGASENGAVELSFDDGDWQPSRNAAGYWWFDWGYFTPGTHKIVARLRDNDGKTIKKSPVVKVEVI